MKLWGEYGENDLGFMEWLMIIYILGVPIGLAAYWAYPSYDGFFTQSFIGLIFHIIACGVGIGAAGLFVEIGKKYLASPVMWIVAGSPLLFLYQVIVEESSMFPVGWQPAGYMGISGCFFCWFLLILRLFFGPKD